MPRRNLYLLWFAGLFCLLCYAQSDPLGRVLAQTLRRIQWRSIEEVDEEKLFEGAVKGMVDTLQNEFGDHHAVYFPPPEAKVFEQRLKEEFDGLGVYLGMDPKTGQITVLSPIYGSPASKGGIQANDRIIAINGEPTKGLTVHDASQKMSGTIDVPVVLHIQRPKQENGTDGNSSDTTPQEMDVELRRAVVKKDTVLGDRRNLDGSWDFMLEGQDKIGYIRISSFTDNTTEEMRRAIDQLQRNGMKGLIIDLRDNPGGYLGSAVEFCDMFIDSGRIVSTRGRSRDFWSWFKNDNESKQGDAEPSKKFNTRDKFSASEEGTLDKNFPVAVLINEDSASAAEIVAACLQDHHRAKIIGERSFGKGTIQEVMQIGGGRGELKLTSAIYWRPSKKNINRFEGAKEEDDWGVRPDPGFKVPLDRDTRKTVLLTRARRDVHYSDAFKINKEWLQSEVKEGSEKGQAEKGPQKLLPLIDPATPMIDIDPQLRKAVEWVKANEE